MSDDEQAANGTEPGESGDEHADEGDTSQAVEATFEHEFDEARSIMYEAVAEQFGEDALDEELANQVEKYLTELYDNREELAARQAQAAQAQAGRPPQ